MLVLFLLLLLMLGMRVMDEEDKRLSGLQLRMKGLEDVRHEEAEDRRPPASGCVLMDVQAIECHAATSCCSACGENVEASAHPSSSLQAQAIRRSRLAGKDGLTDVDIDNISRHYGQTIRRFDPKGSVEELRQRLLAIYAHARSTDAEPRHMSCPPGADSWCWMKRAEAAGEDPEPHSSKNLYLSGLSSDLLRKVFQVFHSLTEPGLLSRCLKKETQNRNESMHSKLWRMCLKVKFAYLRRAVFAARITSLQHNCGKVEGNVLVALGLIPRTSVATRKRKEVTPVKPPPAKKTRRSHEEPSTSYAPGGF